MSVCLFVCVCILPWVVLWVMVCLVAACFSQNMLFVEASAKTAGGVADVFEAVAAKLAGGLPVSVSARGLA